MIILSCYLIAVLFIIFFDRYILSLQNSVFFFRSLWNEVLVGDGDWSLQTAFAGKCGGSLL